MKSRYAFLFLLCVLLASNAFGAVYTASDDPGPGEFATIQAAVDLCSPTDSVQILGLFAENVVINTNDLTFFGDGEIDGGMGDAFTFTTLADNIEMHGFRISGIFVPAGCNGLNIYDNCFFAGGIEDDCVTPGINTWNSNYYHDHTGVAPYLIFGGAQQDNNPHFATIAPTTSTATLALGDQVVFDVDYLTNGICAGQAIEEIKVVEYTVSWDAGVLDYVSYADGDGMPGNGQYLIDESGVAGGTLIVTATSLDEVMTEDGNLGHITFEAINVTCAATTTIAAAGTAYTPEQTPQIVPVAFGSTTVTVADGVAPVVDAFAANNPFGDDTYSAAGDLEIATLEVSDDVDLYYAWYCFDNSGSWVAISELGNSAAPPPFVTSDAIVTPIATGANALSDGAHTLDIMVRDHCGNNGFYVYNFTVDNTGPVVTALTLSDDDGCAQAGYADGIVKVMAVGDGTEVNMDIANRLLPASWTYTGFNPYASSVDIDLTGQTDGFYNFAVQLEDAYGNAGAWVYADITLAQDFCGPVGFDVTPARSSSLTVPWTLTSFSCPEGFVAFIVTDDAAVAADCSAPGWNTTPTYAGSFTFTDNSQGIKTLYLGAIDNAGNITVVSDTFEYDTRGPLVSGVVINSGDACTDNLNVTVTVTYRSRGGDLTNGISLSETQGSHTVFVPVPVSSSTTTADIPWPFSWPPDGMYTIYALGQDDLGNTDGEGSDDIWVDGNAPTLTNMVQRDLDYPVGPGGNAIHSGWSNETTVNLVFTGVTDAGDFDFVVSEAGDFSDEVVINVGDAAVTDNGGGAYDVAYAYVTAPADGASATLTVKIRDCSGRESGTDSDAINFDLMSKGAASIDAFDAVNDPTNTLANNFNVTATDDFSGVYQMMIYEAGYEGSASYAAFATPASITLADDGDGERTVGIYVADRAGNITGPTTTTITVDTEGPAGAFELVSTNPNAYAGEPFAYTNTNNCELVIDVPGDCVQIAVRNYNKTGMAWDAFTYMAPAPLVAWTIDWGAETFDYVEVAFQDAASNWSYVVDSIMVDVTAIGAFGALADEGVAFGDGTHCGVWYGTGADYYFANAYYLRWGNYPVYEGVFPPQPTSNPGEGFFIGSIPAPYNAFLMDDEIDATEDVYRFSIYQYDSAGNVTQNLKGDLSGYWAVSTSYLQGDLDFDGGLSFMVSESDGLGDFARFASAYYSVEGGPYWDDDCDFSDQFDTQAWPEPDDVVNIYDLMDFVLNYTDYADGWTDKSSQMFFTYNYDWSGGAPKIAPHAPVEILAQIPDRLAADQEFTVKFALSNASEIMGLHMVFGLDENIEVVSVNQGEMFNTNDKTFFYQNVNEDNFLIDGAIFNKNGFAKEEIAEVTLRAKSDIAEFNLDNIELLIRDANNQDVEVTISTTVEKTVILPTEFALGQNYPNPFNPATNIELALPIACNYRLDIFNVAGQKVTTFSGHSEAGIVEINWDASNYASGVYFYKVEAGAFSATKKMILVK